MPLVLKWLPPRLSLWTMALKLCNDALEKHPTLFMCSVIEFT